MSPDKARDQLRSIAKFQVTRFQYLLAFIAAASILGLGFASIVESNSTVNQARILSAVETPAASIIFTQRESLVYATRLAQWSNGGTTRRNVQISRNLLAQRLAVIDTSGRSMGSRAKSSYWNALKESDAIVASAPPGVLPEQVHMSFSMKISPIIDKILAESRQLVVSYQRSIDQEMIKKAKITAQRDRLNLTFFYIFIIASGLFLFLNVRTNFKNYRIARVALEAEQVRLDRTIVELKSAQSTVLELQDLNQAKNAFISTVNHELRTPLTSIIGYIDVIRDEKLAEQNPEMLGYLDVLDRNAQILLNLVESMLSLSKIDSAEGKLATAKVSLHTVVDNAIFLMKPAYEKKNIEISFTPEDDLFVEGDAGELNQVLINLLGNAIKFSPDKSTIEIKLESATSATGIESAKISITDHGIGIPAEDIDKLFTRFFRAKNAVSDQYPGTGLGLSIVAQVVTRHGGTIDLTSTVGEGSTFIVEIPLYLTAEDKLILERRGDVLDRAIASLTAATADDIKTVTHDIGGAIGFYGFLSEGEEILAYSRFLSDGPAQDYTSEKERLLKVLHSARTRIDGEKNE